MKNKSEEFVQRINSCYVGDDCVQLMVPYKNAITILDKNGIVYHHKMGSEFFINNYIEDERRIQFPYHSIPTHYKRFIDGKYCYTNQLFNFDEPYIRINDQIITESYVVKDGKEALAISKIMPIKKTTSFKTREEMEEMIKPKEDENIYYLELDGTMPPNNELKLATENKIFDLVKGALIQFVNDLSDFAENKIYLDANYYLNKLKNQSIFFEFLEKSIDKLDLNDYNMNIQLNGGRTILLVKINGKDISIEGLDIYFIKPNYYEVDSYEFPITKYTLEQIKYLTSKIAKMKEPKIPLRLNPGITKEDLKREKQLILQKK